MEPVLVLDRVEKTFVENGVSCPALGGISLEVRADEIVCIMGPSGCGKTTLLRIIGGLEQADRGTIQGCGQAPRGHPLTAMVFQEHALFPWLPVLENITYGLRLSAQRIPDDEIAERARHLLSLTHLDAFSSSLPHQLSGGMKQRVAVARALAVYPRVLLMDEPFSALDPFTRRELEDEILRIRGTGIQGHGGVTILFITHNPEEAVYLADRIVVLSERPAVVRDIFSVDISHPRDPADPRFIRLREALTRAVRGTPVDSPP